MNPLFFRLEDMFDFVQWTGTLNSVEGSLYEMQAWTLMMLAEYGNGVGEIVEIGSFCGKSTCCLALGSMRAQREKVTAIDHFKGSKGHQNHERIIKEGSTFGSFQDNIERMGVDGWINPIVASSEEAVKNWDKKIRLLFIDGAHDYESVKKDFELWSPFVCSGGYVCFHDVIKTTPGVYRFYNEVINSTTEFKEILMVLSLRVIQRNHLIPTTKVNHWFSSVPNHSFFKFTNSPFVGPLDSP